MLCLRALNFDHGKTFSENIKPIGARLWLLYKITRINVVCNFLSNSLELNKGILPPLTK